MGSSGLLSNLFETIIACVNGNRCSLIINIFNYIFLVILTKQRKSGDNPIFMRLINRIAIIKHVDKLMWACVAISETYYLKAGNYFTHT